MNDDLSPVPPDGLISSLDVILHAFIGARLERVEEVRDENEIRLHFSNGCFVAFVFDAGALALIGNGFRIGES